MNLTIIGILSNGLVSMYNSLRSKQKRQKQRRSGEDRRQLENLKLRLVKGIRFACVRVNDWDKNFPFEFRTSLLRKFEQALLLALKNYQFHSKTQLRAVDVQLALYQALDKVEKHHVPGKSTQLIYLIEETVCCLFNLFEIESIDRRKKLDRRKKTVVF